MKKYWKEIKQPKSDIEYWVVYNNYDESYHYFKTKTDADEYASWNYICEENVMKECFN